MKKIPMLSHIQERFRETSEISKHTNIADIWDRLAAFVFDFIFLVLLTNLIFAPLKKKLQIAILDEHDGAVQIYFWLLFFGFALIFIAYHSVSICFYKKTIGKKVFGIEVQSSIDEKEINLGHCILRSLIQLLSLLLFGLPFLQVFSHKMRRPLHDRAADSIVCSLKKKGVPPSFIEKLWVRVIYATVIVNVIIILFVQMYFIKVDIADITDFVTEPDYVCDDVSEAKEFWPQSEHANRLDIALTLFGAGEIDKDCLETEAQKFLSFEQQLDKAYLAKAFAHEDRAEISNQYLQRVCQENETSESCFLTKMIEAWADKRWKDVDLLLESHHQMFAPFVKVWAIQHYERKQDFENVLKLTQSLIPNRTLASFTGKYKAEALWNLGHQEEAEQLFETTYTNMARDQRGHFLAEMCRLETEGNCVQQANKACRWLVQDMKLSHLEYHSDMLLSTIRAQKCSLTNIDEIVARYRNLVDDPRMQLLLAAIKAQDTGKRFVAEQILKNLVETSEEASYFNYEVRSRLLDLASDKKDFEEIVHWWTQSDVFNKYHRQFGLEILRTLMKQKHWDLALKISQKISDDKLINLDLQKDLAVVYFKNNKFSIARRFIERIEGQTRQPASFSDYLNIRAQLKGGTP